MTGHIEQLRYVHLGCRDPEAAARAAVDRLGMELVSAEGGEWHLRGDHRASSLVFSSSRQQAVGFEVSDVAALDAIAAALAARGVAARRDDALAARRLSRALLAFTTFGGCDIELVVRPRDNAWRFFPTGRIGLLGLTGVALRSTRPVEDEALLCEVLGLQVRDWIGDAAYLGCDEAHHRLSLHPATAGGVLGVDFQLDSLDQMMQAYYRMHDAGELPLHGPGRRPVSGQAFLSFEGPEGVCFSYTAEGRRMAGTERPRQYAAEPASYCSWGSACRIADYTAQAPVRGRPQLREVGA